MDISERDLSSDAEINDEEVDEEEEGGLEVEQPVRFRIREHPDIKVLDGKDMLSSRGYMDFATVMR